MDFFQILDKYDKELRCPNIQGYTVISFENCLRLIYLMVRSTDNK